MATKKSSPDFFNVKPKNIQTTSLVKEFQLDGGGDTLLTMEADADPGVNIAVWLQANKAEVADKLRERGAILFRGFDVCDGILFKRFMDAWDTDQMLYVDQSSPRTLIDNKIYTSTDHPHTEIINWHSELSYSHQWPQFIVFNCHVPASTGGETFICDNRKVLAGLPVKIKEKFSKFGILYERNLIPGLGLSWKKVYQTDDKDVVEAYCRERNIEFEWHDDNHLRLRWHREAIISHPETSELLWFNHGFFFNASNLDKHVKEALSGNSTMPFNTYYGNGEEVDEETLKAIRQAYQRVTISTPWLKGDLLLLDNMVMSHGRNSFEGERKVVVSMCGPVLAKSTY